MKKIQIKISGPQLLMANPEKMVADAASSAKGKLSIRKQDYDAEADSLAYKLPTGELYIPARALFKAIINGASYKKAGKYNLKAIIAAAVRIEPEQIALGTNKYEIDLRPVVIQSGMRKNRVIRARPLVRNWKATFQIVYNENLITDADIIKTCVQDAGERVGILEFSPRNYGPYGTFQIDEFKVQK